MNQPEYLTGQPLYKEHQLTSEGATICNPRFRIIVSNWDNKCKNGIQTGLDFRITEKGKTDLDLEPGMYSIHSPLYGTDWGDNNAFEDRYSCRCGEYIGKRYMDSDFICPKCGKKVTFVDTNLMRKGWFILDRNVIIHPGMYKKLAWFFGKEHLYQMLKFVPDTERSKYMDAKSSPFYGIGMLEFYDEFDNILEYYYKKNKKRDGYEFFKIYKEEVFTHSIPCYNKALRRWMVRNGDVRYCDEDKIFMKLFSDHMLLNDDFEWQRRVDYRKGRKKDTAYLRKENILHRIQGYVNDLWDSSFEAIERKEGIINEQILGGRLNFTARNVIVPAPYLNVDEISLGYTTFLELYKLELVALMHELYDIPFPQAWNMWIAASAVYSDKMYQLMKYLMTHNEMYWSIDRPPSINHGSYITMKVVEISPDMTDYCMGLPPYVLQKANADFDGDILTIFCHKIGKISREYYIQSNPRSNLCVSHNDGNYDVDTSLFKDAIVGLFAFLNC